MADEAGYGQKRRMEFCECCGPEIKTLLKEIKEDQKRIKDDQYEILNRLKSYQSPEETKSVVDELKKDVQMLRTMAKPNN